CSFERLDFLRCKRRKGVEHAMIETGRRPQHFNFARIDVASRLFIHPNQIPYSSRISAALIQCFQHIDLAGSSVTVFSQVGVKRKDVYPIEIDAFFRDKVKRQNARLSGVCTTDSQSFSFEILERLDVTVTPHDYLGVKVTIAITHTQ